MDDLDPMAQAQLEDEIRRTLRQLSEVTTQVARTAEAKAHARHDFKLAYAKAMLRSGPGTVSEREARALVASESEHEDMEVTEALFLAARETAGNLRAQLDSLRTLAANVRSVVVHEGG